ncbi:MAG: aminodeoxychorismate lyase [Candidatus Omnitrophica bacterium]|nr:aminodeoxychorismate lyase [Candidatus Omnitrophota bacterium]
MRSIINNQTSGRISVFDRGFLYGDGLFETMRSYDGNIFKFDEHLSRLFYSAKILRIKIPDSKEKLRKAVCGTLKKKHLKNAYIRITVTRGEGAFSLKRGRRSKPNVIIIIKEYEGYPETFYSRGITAAISHIRQDEFSPLSGIKSLNFLNHILARLDAQRKGFDDAILRNIKGDIAEGATSNIFLVKRGRLITPSLDSGILPGITRKNIIRIAKKLGIFVEERAVLCADLARADEVFFTNSLAELLPVVKIGPEPVGGGKPGRITKLLHVSYRKMVLLRCYA